jgi:glycosyltransferase involved in cell wall biosynthesis
VNYPAHPNLKVYQYGRMRLKNSSNRLGLYWCRIENRLLRRALAHGHFDIFHPTYYTLVTGQNIGSYRHPTVITVWDMIHELFPKEMDPTGRHAEEKRRAIMAAQAVICISENTRKDLLERYPVREDRVRVTHLASEIDASISHGAEPVPARPYFLYVGRSLTLKRKRLAG